MMKPISLAVLIALAGLMAYVRFAPVTAALWHIDLTSRPAPVTTPSPDRVTQLRNGAYPPPPAPLARIDAAPLPPPPPRRIAGTSAEGRITYETRSLIWCFPDYPTAQSTPQGTLIFARQRFGGNDWGVNADRLRDWLAKL